MFSFTVGDYLAERLSQLRIFHHFVVPGDYNLTLLDKLDANANLNEVGCTNELNCALAAEGYARCHGIGVCIVTFSVGAFSAFNGIGSAYAENLPVILVSGAPNTNDTHRHLLHHTLGEHDFTYQYDMAKRITCCAVQIRAAYQAPGLIDRALRASLLERKPAYIEIPTNLAGETCARPGPLTALTSPVPSDDDSVEAAVVWTSDFLDSKQKPIILVGPKLQRVGAQRQLLCVAEQLGCAVVLQPAAKGSFPEDHAQYAGIFWGQVSTLAADVVVNWADVVLCIGTVFTDYSTLGWTNPPTIPQIVADTTSVTVPGPGSAAHFSNVRLAEFLHRLAESASRNDRTIVEYNRLRVDPPLAPATLDRQSPLTRCEVARQVQALLTPETTVFADTGDSWFNGIHLSLPHGARFEIEMQWGHIGWSVPAAYGYALASPGRRIVVLIGDGAFQVTAQEVSQMVRSRTPVILVLMNNGGYTIEVEIHDGPYNRIQNWDYAALVQAFGPGPGSLEDTTVSGEDNMEGGGGGKEAGWAQGLRARTAEELAQATQRALEHQLGPTLIECVLDRDDCNRELITWGHFVAAANARKPVT
ncbi:3-oxoacyl-reductase [Apiospora arundinis]